MSKAQSEFPSKILLITDLYPIEDNDTIPFAIENFALGLKDFNIETTVIRPNFLLNTILRKHKIYKEGLYQRNGIEIYNKNFFLPFIFNDFIPKDNFDLIISHMPSGTIYADLLNKKLNLPHISIVHQSDLKVLEDFKYSIYFKNRLKKALNNSNLVGARNSTISKKIKADFILPSFVEKKFILNKKRVREKLKIITLSRLIKRKNINMVIDALSKLNVDFEYEIYGSGREKNNLQKLIKKYNLENKITLNSAIGHDLIWDKLDKSDIFILPSENETFGLCYLEAMARGLVVIAKKDESMENIIKNKENGFLVNNSDDIKNVLEELTLNKKQEIANYTLLNIKKYEKEKILKDYIEIMKKVIK